MTYCLPPGCPRQRWQHAGPRDQGSGARRGWAQACHGRLREHLRAIVVRHGKSSWVRDRVPLSVISAKVKLADLCKSMLSEYTSVDNARRGSPEKKSVSARWVRSVCRRAEMRRRAEVRFQGSPADRQRPHARCRPAQDRRYCPWSALDEMKSVLLCDGWREVDAYRHSRARTAWRRSWRRPW